MPFFRWKSDADSKVKKNEKKEHSFKDSCLRFRQTVCTILWGHLKLKHPLKVMVRVWHNILYALCSCERSYIYILASTLPHFIRVLYIA